MSKIIHVTSPKQIIIYNNEPFGSCFSWFLGHYFNVKYIITMPNSITKEGCLTFHIIGLCLLVAKLLNPVLQFFFQVLKGERGSSVDRKWQRK